MGYNYPQSNKGANNIYLILELNFAVVPADDNFCLLIYELEIQSLVLCILNF